MAYATMEGSVTRTYKERCAEAAGGFLDGIDKIDRIAETDTPNASNPVNPVKDPPRLPASNNSALSDSNLTLSSVTNPCFYGIEKGTDAVTLGVAWPDAHSLPNGRLDVFGHWQLASGGWTRLAQVDVSGAQPPAAVEIDVGSFPTDAMERMAFFRLATQDDSDGDGLSDAYEAWTLGTGPANPDTDGDGLGDGDEVALETDPLGADTDGDGVVDGAETGCVVKADGFEWYDTTGWATVYGTSYGDGLHSYWGALAVASLPDGLTVLGSLMSKAVCFDNGVMYLNAPGSNVALVFPELATPLDRGTYSMGDILVAPYWCSTALVDGDASSCMRTGIVESNGCFVVEYRNVRLRGTSDDRRMTYQVIVPGGTGSVVRVSYLASDVWLDGSDAVVGVQVRRIVTPDGLYNLTWDFAERGPILPGTTVEYRLGHGSDPLRADTDGDGLDDGAEVALGTLPTSADTDGDGLDDDVEIGLGTNPLSADSDGDGLRDDWEVAHGLDPLVSAGDDGAGADPDGDGLTNLQEQQWGTGPLNADTDGDGLSDRQEVNVYGTSPINADTDGDGLKDGDEVGRDTNPLATDSDGDGLLDGWEVAQGLDPVDASGENGASGDMDGDGLCNSDEQSLGTDPHAADSDGDGVSDFLEICNGSDPVDGGDGGKPPVNFPYRGIRFDINGDYAAWSMTVAGLGPFDRLSDTFSMASPGAGSERLRVLKKGNSYRLTMQWLNSDGHTDPNWYCWQAKVNGLPTAPSYESYKAVRLPGNEVVHGLGWMAENAGGLLTSHVHMREDKGGNVAEGLEATLHVYRCEVSICDPDDEAWPELAASRVLLDDEELRIRVTVTPAIADFDLFRRVMGSNVVVSTSGACPDGVAIPVSASEFFSSGMNSEVRMTRTRAQLIELGLLPAQDEDDVDEMAWIDMANLAADSGQNLSDSEAFSSLGYEFRGKATRESTKSLESQPPNSIPSESFFKAAGCEVVSVSYGGVWSSKRQIMNQADYFYFSGHGNHATGHVQGGFSPTMVNNKWTRDVKVAILAGCAVLDVRNYRLNTQKFLYRVRHFKMRGSYPGERWENCGAKILLGYALKAPLDSRGGTAIASRFVEQVKSGRSVIEAWKIANDCPEGRNACAIDCVSDSREFWFWDESSGHAVWTSKKKEITGWQRN